jgi:hypothetical protein
LWLAVQVECVKKSLKKCSHNVEPWQAEQFKFGKLIWKSPFFWWNKYWKLTPKGPRPFFGPFLKFGEAIVDAIFVQKISNFRWTCGLVLASRRTNFYKISIYSLGAMLQKQNYFEVRAARAANFFIKKNKNWFGFFSINSSQSS